MTYAECVSITLGIPYAMRLSHIVIKGLARTFFPTSTQKRHDFWEEKVTEHKDVCFDFIYEFC